LQQPSLKQEESSPKIVTNSTPDIEILNVSKLITEKHSTMTASALRVKKRLFLQNEASNSEANRQLEWEKNRQKLINLAANKTAVQQSAVATSTTVIVDNMNKIIVDGNGKISVSGTNNKALLTLQGRKLGDVIKEGKFVKKGGLITGVIGIEMERGQCHISGVQNIEVSDGNIQTGKYSSEKNCASLSEGSKLEAVSPPAQSTSCKAGRDSMNNAVNAVSTPDIKRNETPVSTLSSGQVLQGCLIMESSTTTNSTTSSTSSVVLQNSVQTFRAISASVDQSSLCGADKGKKNVVTEPMTEKNSEVVCISDDSDNSDVEFVGTVYNPKLDYSCDKKNMAKTTLKHSTVSTQANSASQRKHIAPKSVSLVQGETCTTRIKLGTSPCNSTKPVCSTVTTQDSCTLQQIRIAPKTALHVTRETSISTVKPVMSACSRNRRDNSTKRTQDGTVLQQTHIAPKPNPHMQGEMSTASMKPITSTFNSAATLPNRLQALVVNPHTVTTQFAPNTSQIQAKVEQQSPANIVELQMHIASQQLDNLSERMQKPVIVQSGSSVNVLRNCLLQTESINYVQSQSLAPSTVDTVVSPFSPSSTKSTENLHVYNSLAAPGTVTHAQKFNSISNTAANNIGIQFESQLVSSYTPVNQSPFLVNPYTASTGASPDTPVIQMRTSSILSEQAKRPADSFTQIISPGGPVAKANSPVPKPSSFSHFPGTSLTPTRIIGPPLDQARSPSISCEKIRYPGTPGGNSSHLTPTGGHSLPPEVRTPNKRIPGTPVMHTRSPVSSVTQARNPAIQVAQIRIPGTPVAYARSSGTPRAKTRSPSTPVAQVRSPGSIHFTQTASPGASFVQARSSVSPSFQSQIQGVRVSPTAASVSHGRGGRSSGPEGAASDVQQQMEQTAARLVVIPGDENVSKYAIVFPSGAKVILTPKQVADIRAANGGLLTTNM
jgi:hypothetical protein